MRFLKLTTGCRMKNRKSHVTRLTFFWFICNNTREYSAYDTITTRTLVNYYYLHDIGHSEIQRGTGASFEL